MSIKLIASLVGSLFPVIFPDQEFKPKRAGGVLVCFLVAVVAINWLGLEGTLQAIEVTEEFIELTEE